VPSLRVGVGAGTPISVDLCVSARCGETEVVIGAELVGRGVELSRGCRLLGVALLADAASAGADRLGMRTGELLGGRGAALLAGRGGLLLAGRGGLLLGGRGGVLLAGRGIGVGMRAATGGALGATAAVGADTGGAAGAAEG